MNSTKNIILPTGTSSSPFVETSKPAEVILLQTTQGNSKSSNEDRIGYSKLDDGFILCLCDGHWGDKAASRVVEYFLETAAPSSREDALKITRPVETRLWQDAGQKHHPDPESDFTPETSFVTAWYDNHHQALTIISYGDARSALISSNRVIHTQTKATWLGAFSYLGLRDRISLDNALQFQTYRVAQGDTLVLYTDGVDECVYEVPTISRDEIIEVITTADTVGIAAQRLFDKVFTNGAEDNATIAIAVI